ncbi:BolA family protein [Pararhodobacter sp.]|uniref:BolA family protein n=1 Tax=Pararhodobacter sp. TaxID=2127056 RepID=UPI002FDE7054
MSAQNRVIEEMEHRLRAGFAIDELVLEDESEQHRGHAGWREGGATHFHIALQSPDFKGLSRIERHRAVHAALGADLVARIHALRMTLT